MLQTWIYIDSTLNKNLICVILYSHVSTNTRLKFGNSLQDHIKGIFTFEGYVRKSSIVQKFLNEIIMSFSCSNRQFTTRSK